MAPELPAARPSRSVEPALGLAFGGGGMKGWAHVGVLSVLERHELRPGVVAGCSAGALIGAYYAFGYSLDDMRRFMREQRTSSLFSLRFDGQGLLSNDAFRDYLARHLEDCTFDDLEIPFYVVCTDLETGKEVVLNKGSLVDAILASSAIPGVFAPVEVGGRLLVDGGLCNNVPVSALVNHGTRYTVAVRLHQDWSGLQAPPLRKRRNPDGSDAERRVSMSMWAERLARTIRRDADPLPNGFEVMGRAMEIVVSQIEGFRLQSGRPDVLITPEVAHISTFSFSEEKEDIFNCGVRAAEAQAERLTEIRRRLDGRLPRQVSSSM